MSSASEKNTPDGTKQDPFPEDGVLKCENPADDPCQVAIALHFVEQDASKNETRPTEVVANNVFTSMELDLLAYQFQFEVPPPVKSQCALDGPRDLYIEYQTPYCYNTEGSERWINGKSQVLGSAANGSQSVPPIEEGYSRLKTRVMLSYTDFRASDIRVWHAVITPAKPGHFNEFDILKLIHLYDGRTESTELHKKVRFRLGQEPAVIFRGAETLLERLGSWSIPRLNAESRKITEAARFIAGTIQIGLPHDDPAQKLFEKILKERTDAAAPGILEALQTNETRVLRAIGGIVTGIFDFRNVDAEELLDTLVPTFADGRVFLRINRCSLIGFTPDDRVLRLERVQEQIGMSPYLLLPHSAIIHNETLVRRAEKALKTEVRAAIEAARLPFFHRLKQVFAPQSTRPLSLAELEGRLDEAERDLGQLQLRNIFNYHTERTLFEEGMKMRGAVDKRKAVLAQYKGAKEEVELLWKVRDGWGQVWHAAFLSLLSALPVRPLLETLGWPSWLLYVVMVVLFGAIVFFRSRGLKRKSSRDNDKGSGSLMPDNHQTSTSR